MSGSAARLRGPFLFVSRLLIGVLFIYSGFSKLLQPVEYFEVAIHMYRILPPNLIHLAAVTIPWVELICGVFLFLGYMQEKTAGVLALLTALFQVILGQAVWRRLPMDECGCFGGGFIHLTLYQSFVLDTVLLLILIQIATAHRNILSLDNRLLGNRDTV